jgi:hypothetical protein
VLRDHSFPEPGASDLLEKLIRQEYRFAAAFAAAASRHG